MINYSADLPRFVPLAAVPSTLRVLCLGDSTTDDNNPGHYDNQTVSAGIECHYKSSTEYSPSSTTAWAVTDSGMYSNICEQALLRTGVSGVQMVTEADSGSRFIAHKRDQLTDAKTKWLAEGWDPPHLVFIGGIVNDLTANGTGSDGEWLSGQPITRASVERNLFHLVMRVRASAGWAHAQIVFLVPMMENATYPQADDLATWIAEACAKWGGVSAIDVRDARVLLNDEHIDADDASGGGNNMVANRILDEVEVLS